MPGEGQVLPDQDNTDVVPGRVLAQIVDLAVQLPLLFVLAIAISYWVGPLPEAEARLATGLILLSLPAYGTILERFWNGRTIGKWIVGIEVVDYHGRTPSLFQTAVRNVPAIVAVSLIVNLVGLVSIASTDRHQRLFDVAADTYVVRSLSER